MSESQEYDEDVLSQLAAIREGGHCNMLDTPCVKDAAEQIGFEELVEFIESEPNSKYMAHLEKMGEREAADGR